MNSPQTEIIDPEYSELIRKINVIIEKEYYIDETRPLYLFTWCPNPAELPDCDFETQHKFNIKLIAEYLSTFIVGLACVEATQIGNPHYHGWYQVSDEPAKVCRRMALIKVLKRFGLLKITISKGHYKYQSWSPQANCLFYYKKDLLQAMLFVKDNPVTSDSKSDFDWSTYLAASFFAVDGKRQSIADMEKSLSLRQFYQDFYTNSIN